jgi:hypothetical protein
VLNCTLKKPCRDECLNRRKAGGDDGDEYILAFNNVLNLLVAALAS